MVDERDPLESFSFLTPYGYRAGSCGYCKNPTSSERTPGSSYSYHANSSRLTVEHYQALIDRGWRRSGEHLYKPDVRRSCCPHYTIRLPAAQLKVSKNQRQALNRWNKFVLGDEYIKETAKLHPRSKAEKVSSRNSFDLLSTIHASEASTLPHSTFTPAHNFTVTLESSTYTPEKYALYTHYQTTVHRDTPSSLTPSSFRRFLCDSSLPLSTTPTGQRLGTHHQLYRLDGRLIALAVLDLLPHAVSAVYFLYHADHEAASFGKLSALREAALALEGGYEWYYMGYYIHNCAKMRYKADFAPQFVLDPQGYTWDQLDGEFLKALDENALVSMSARRRSRSENTTEREDEVEPGPAASDDGTASVFAAHMPGTLPLSRILETTDLAHKLVCLGGGGKNKPRQMVFLNQLVGWHDDDDDNEDNGDEAVVDPQSLKGIVAELVACTGTDIAREIVVDFSS